MHAMVLTAPGAPPEFEQREDPVPGPGNVRVKVSARAVCPRFSGYTRDGGFATHLVANLTRGDDVEFFKIAVQAGIKTHTTPFPLRQANEVLAKLRAGQITGAAVLQP